MQRHINQCPIEYISIVYYIKVDWFIHWCYWKCYTFLMSLKLHREAWQLKNMFEKPIIKWDGKTKEKMWTSSICSNVYYILYYMCCVCSRYQRSEEMKWNERSSYTHTHTIHAHVLLLFKRFEYNKTITLLTANK